ncbi:SwmB domain-containing protein [Ornithinibacillus salinisoli]|uniref:SwmB domain-containing protein n=1 Tax=Ornithinibacillus salinisoli TaxID=1848459 RepID=A0ABW4W7D7_9BACI
MKRFRSKISVFLIVLLLIGTVMPTQFVFGANVIVPDGHEIDYDDNVPADNAVPVAVAPDLTVTAEDGEVFSGGNIKFQINGGSDPSEKLVLRNGKYTLDGGQEMEILDGVIYLDTNENGNFNDPGEDIAKVNDILNGDGTSLQIDFSTIPLPNGDFEKGNTGEVTETNPIPNWTINTSSIGPNGTTIDQIWLGELAEKTQGRTYDSVVSSGNGTYTVTGPGGEYSYTTNVDYNGTASTSDMQNVEGFEAEFGSLDRYVKNIYQDGETSSQALEIGFLNAKLKSGDYAVTDGQIASSFGAEAISDPFEVNAGDQLGFDWKANDGGDDYEVYGYLIDEVGNHTEILYGRGSAQGWTTNTGVIPADGTYRFRFVSGSFNRTDGTTHGATLSIDNIRILSGKVVASIAEQIGQLVTYETTELLGDRDVDITVTNGTGGVSNTTTVPVLMDNELERSLTIETPTEDEVVYNPTPGITGDVLDGSTVVVDVTGPGGYTYTGTATVTDGEWTINAIDGLTEPGEYTISATASNGSLATDPPVTSTFVFVNKTMLEDYIAEVDDLNREDYQAGWDDFEEALREAEGLIAEIDNMDNDVNPDQAAVDQALKNLQDAKAALEKHSPVHSEPAAYEHGENEITIDFDKDVVLTAGDTTEGFTVTVDGTEYTVTDAVANGDKVTLTVDQPLDSDAEEVKVVYTKNETNPNLFGDEENGSADESFEIVAKDDFGSALQIETTKGNTDNQTPEFTGSVHVDADEGTLTIYDNTGNEVLTDMQVTLNGDGTWTYNVPMESELDFGDYTFEVTAINNETGRTITKSAAFTVVDKIDLQTEYDEVIEFKEEEHRSGWDDFEKAREKADEILVNPTASQDEVNQALDELQTAREALEKHSPVAENAVFEHGGDEIIVEFDKNVKFTDGELDLTAGFTVTVDGVEVDVQNVELVEVDTQGKTKKVKLTLANGTELSSDENVKVFYNKESGSSNLVGDEENGTAVEDFIFQAGDPFGHALQIYHPEGTTNDTTPTIEGTADADADSAIITIIGPDGKELVVDTDELTINPDGTWTYNVNEKLAPGEYTVIVTTSKEGRSDVTKYHTFTVVDKEALIDLEDDITYQELQEDKYTIGSWDKFKDALDKARKVIDDPNAIQAGVDQAKAELEKAYNELVYIEDLKKKVDGTNDLEPSDYTKESWATYLKALDKAKEVLADINATQEEVDVALAELEKALKELEVVDTKENILPKTATDIYNWLLLGVAFILVGTLLFLTRRRRTE